MVITLEKFCWKLLFWQICFFKFRMCFFKVKHNFGHISGMVGPIDVKQKGSASLDTGYNMRPWPLTLLMTLTMDVSRSNFDLIDVKWKGSKLIGYWSDYIYMTLPFDHTLIWPGPWSFKVRVWNSLISGMGQPIDMEQKGCESSIRDHDIN